MDYVLPVQIVGCHKLHLDGEQLKFRKAERCLMLFKSKYAKEDIYPGLFPTERNLTDNYSK